MRFSKIGLVLGLTFAVSCASNSQKRNDNAASETVTNSEEGVHQSADGHSEWSATGTVKETESGEFYLDQGNGDTLALDGGYNDLGNNLAAAKDKQVEVKGFLNDDEETGKSGSLVVEDIKGSSDLGLAAKKPKPRPAPKPKPVKPQSYWRCVSVCTYPLNCILYRYGANAANQALANNASIDACKAANGQRAVCITSPFSGSFRSGTWIANFSDARSVQDIPLSNIHSV